ncbi:hypothetical protein ACQ5TV_12495 [Acetobacter ghanensis]|uniref:hypothetical protein n=1 Tax=Acetobacter ghanensis TaxID=431306 RepID=UPI003D34633C
MFQKAEKVLGWSKNKAQWCLFSLWSIITLTLIYHHAFWLDEVINLIFGIGADNQYGIHGNGHPALWFLLLRGLFAIFHKVWVLPLASFLVAATAVWLFLFKSPFSLRFKILFLCSNFALYEYVVMARNYGISMLVMFILAIVVTNKRFKSNFTGPCLFLLCNTNIHSAIIATSYSLGLIGSAIKNKTIYIRETKIFLTKSVLCNIAGLLVCFFTIFPTFDKVASKKIDQIINFHNLGNAFIVAKTFNKLTYYSYFGPADKSKIQLVKAVYDNSENKRNYGLLIDDDKCREEYLSKKHTESCLLNGDGRHINVYVSIFRNVFIIFCSALIFLSVFSLYGETVLFLSASISLIVLDVFFAFIYWGGYRHQALWLVFMVALLWISKKENISLDNKIIKIRKIGYNAFIILMVLQIWPAISNAYNEIFAKPSSNSKKFSQFIRDNKNIKNGVVISNNDLLLEAMHYYIDTPTFITSERKFDLIFPFAKSANSDYSLDNILSYSNYISACNQVPVIIVLANSLAAEHRVSPEDIQKPTLYNYDYLNFYIDPQQFARFQAQTHKIATFQESLTEPGFNVYVLFPQDAHIEGSCAPQYMFDRKMFDLEHAH